MVNVGLGKEAVRKVTRTAFSFLRNRDSIGA
jgi:hypothetical protein